jgi:hypothetical protein
MKRIVPVGVSFRSVVCVTTPVAVSPDVEVRCPLAMSPSMMTLLTILSQGGGLSVHHLSVRIDTEKLPSGWMVNPPP